MTRIDYLHEAEKQITGKREQDYGKVENNFADIAALWTIYKGREFTAHDVAMMMALLKMARIKNGGGSGDSYVDLIGYAACAGELNALEKNENHVMTSEEILNLIKDKPFYKTVETVSQDEIDNIFGTLK